MEGAGEPQACQLLGGITKVELLLPPQPQCHWVLSLIGTPLGRICRKLH